MMLRERIIASNLQKKKKSGKDKGLPLNYYQFLIKMKEYETFT